MTMKECGGHTENHPFSWEFCCLDLETTGLRNQRDENHRSCSVRINNFQVVDSFVSLVRPQQEIPYYVARSMGCQRNGQNRT